MRSEGGRGLLRRKNQAMVAHLNLRSAKYEPAIFVAAAKISAGGLSALLPIIETST